MNTESMNHELSKKRFDSHQKRHEVLLAELMLHWSSFIWFWRQWEKRKKWVLLQKKKCHAAFVIARKQLHEKHSVFPLTWLLLGFHRIKRQASSHFMLLH